MSNGVGGIGYGSLWGAQRTMSGSALRKSLFGNSSVNGYGSISKDEWTGLQTNLTGQSQNGTPGALSFLNFFQDLSKLKGVGNTSSSGGTATDLFSKIDTNGDGSISKDELTQALSLASQLKHGGATGADSGVSSSAVDQLFSAMDTNGDGSISKDEFAAFQSTMTTQLMGTTTQALIPALNLTSGGATTAAFVQQAIGRYMQLTPAGQAVAGAGSLLGIG